MRSVGDWYAARRCVAGVERVLEHSFVAAEFASLLIAPCSPFFA